MYDIPHKTCKKCEKRMEWFYFNKGRAVCINCEDKKPSELDLLRRNDGLKSPFNQIGCVSHKRKKSP